jgi:hypothetical protein
MSTTQTQPIRFRKMNDSLEKALDLSLDTITIEFLKETFKETAVFRSDELVVNIQSQIKESLKKNVQVCSLSSELNEVLLKNLIE